MTIETKYTPGQKLWTIYENKVQEFMVESVQATAIFNYSDNKPGNPSCKYYLRVGVSTGYRSEVYEFELDRNYASSKEELLKSL